MSWGITWKIQTANHYNYIFRWHFFSYSDQKLCQTYFEGQCLSTAGHILYIDPFAEHDGRSIYCVSAEDFIHSLEKQLVFPALSQNVTEMCKSCPPFHVVTTEFETLLCIFGSCVIILFLESRSLTLFCGCACLSWSIYCSFAYLYNNKKLVQECLHLSEAISVSN